LLKAGLVRLYYNLDRYKEDNKYLKDGSLERFNQLLYVLINGTAYNDRLEDQPAIYIHNQRIGKSSKKEFEGNNRRSGYFLAEKCFDSFMKKDKAKRFRKNSNPKEIYLLPSEKKEIERKKSMHE